MISVIIPIYNVEQYLFVCLNSVLRQIYQDFKIIFIDDASSDSSPDILNYFSKKEGFFSKFQEVCKVFIEKYGIYGIIKEMANPHILNFFKFDDLRCEND